jgi:hypothetical protein
MVSVLGFEPRLTASRAAVLPLDDSELVASQGFEPCLTAPQAVVLTTNTISRWQECRESNSG